ncbi:hypothetical protein [Luteolibacter sp. AS25]|uniref:hypothetical protein n=1 Tax=Luteolibacter sp. AS25 TaxID=3135776 RepID=UPI00398AA976
MSIRLKQFGIISVFFLSLMDSYAGMKIQRSVRTIQELDEARSEAREKGKALVFVYTDTKTTCGLCIAATEKAFDELDRYAVPVLLDMQDKAFYEEISPVIGGALHAPEMGNFIPKAVVTSDDMGTLLGSINYESMSSGRNFSALNKEVKSTLTTMEEGGVVEAKSVVPVWYCTKTEGHHFSGEFIGIGEKKGGKQLVIASENGKSSRIALSRLTPGAVEYAESLKEASDSKNTEDANTSIGAEVIHSWESQKGGKTIKGKFISLEEGKLTIEKEESDRITFDISLLSDESRATAEKLAAGE